VEPNLGSDIQKRSNCCAFVCLVELWGIEPQKLGSDANLGNQPSPATCGVHQTKLIIRTAY